MKQPDTSPRITGHNNDPGTDNERLDRLAAMVVAKGVYGKPYNRTLMHAVGQVPSLVISRGIMEDYLVYTRVPEGEKDEELRVFMDNRIAHIAAALRAANRGESQPPLYIDCFQQPGEALGLSFLFDSSARANNRRVGFQAVTVILPKPAQASEVIQPIINNPALAEDLLNRIAPEVVVLEAYQAQHQDPPVIPRDPAAGVVILSSDEFPYDQTISLPIDELAAEIKSLPVLRN